MWMSRRQVRWLVILLALLPLIPSILMVRLMLDSARRERDEAVEMETAVYRDQLIHLVNRTSMNGAARGDEGGDALFAQLRRIFGDDVTLILRSSLDGAEWKWGEDPTSDAIVARIREGRYEGWTVVLDRVVTLPEYIGEQLRMSWWRAAGISLGMVVVASVVWFGVHRGLRVDELRSDLLTTVSHEMKTPLASMRVLLETLTDGEVDILKSDSRRREYLDLVLRENRRLTRLADDFLTFARLERGEYRLRREVCGLRGIVDDLLVELAPAIDLAGARVECAIPESLRVLGDEEAIAGVIRNLVENALKYGFADGESPEIVIIGAVPQSGRGRVSLAVADQGPGIPAELRRAVFRRYFRIDSRLAGGGSGVGLGLAISRHLVRRMKGRISLEPNPGGGCRFVVLLRAATPEESSVAEEEAAPAVSVSLP